MIIDKETNSLAALSGAVELGVALIFEVAGNDLGETTLNEQGREGVASTLLTVIQRELVKTSPQR